ncbi:MAG: hypothetical protein JKY08_04625 [Flavobacteriaceae bacterium]|nr:hypothetical protein [Flavobacteriaceae bacterium]
MKKIVLILTVMCAVSSFAQKMKVTEGSIKNLKGIRQFDVIFEYHDLKIPKFDSEVAFLKEKMDKRETKNPGSGEKFKKTWFNDREERYHPMFLESFNKRFVNDMVSVTENSDASYVIKIHTTKLYAGYNIGIVRHNAEIDAIVTVYKKTDPTIILLEGTYRDVPGNGAFGNDYDSGFRISHCYAKLGKNIANYIRKKAK